MKHVVKTGRWQAHELPIAWQRENQQHMNLDLEAILALITDRGRRRTIRSLAQSFRGHAESHICRNQPPVIGQGPVRVRSDHWHDMNPSPLCGHGVDGLLASYFMKAQAVRLRAQVPMNETVLIALAPRRRDVLITLSLGRGLSDQSPLGIYGVDLLRRGETQWWIALLRPRGAPTESEKRTAHRFCQVSRWLGLNIEEFLIIGRRRYWQAPHFMKKLTAPESLDAP